MAWCEVRVAGVVCLMMAASGALAQRGGDGALGGLNAKQPLASVRFGGVMDNGQSGASGRTLEGQVTNAQEKPLPGALVYVKNLKTNQMLSVSANEAGRFRFVALAKDVDYQFWAQNEKQKSEMKTISSFDDTMQIHRNLMFPAKAAPSPASPK